MTPTFPAFARAVHRLNPLPAQRREWNERTEMIAARLDASASADRRAVSA